jgi:predicted RNase H-like HicB family nuclease
MKACNKMDKVIVEIYFTGKNFCAHAPVLPGCVSTADNLADMEKNIREAIAFHVEGSLQGNDPVPDVFKGPYELRFVLTTGALLEAYSGIFTKAALSRMTGINERQLWHYAAGVRKPRRAQAKRIEEGIHKLGRELLTIQVE